MKKTGMRIILALLLISAAASVNAQEILKDRKAEKVMNGYISAIGGQTALNNIHNLVSLSELQFIESGLVINREIVETCSDQIYIRISSPQTGEIRRGYDGKTCWENRQGTIRTIEGDEKKSFLNSSYILRFAGWEKHLTGYTYEGLVKEKGIEMHRIKVTTRFGISETWFFNKNNNHLVRIEEPLHMPDGKAIITTTFEDYRDVNGVKLPFTLLINMPGQSRQISFSSITPNKEFDSTLFTALKKE